MMFITITIILIIVIAHNVDGAGFVYPSPPMPDPINAQTLVIYNLLSFIRKYETPIQIRFTSIIDEAFWNCLASYDEIAFDAVTKQPPRVRADANTIDIYGNSKTKMLCSAYATLIILGDIMPESVSTIAELLNSWTLDGSLTTVNMDITNCGITNIDCMETVAATNNYEPEIMASIVALGMLDYLANDGWNADGSIGINGGECTGNCRAYADYTGYEPKKGNPNRWKPLLEDNGKGFFYHYDHVVPHIGLTADPKGISRSSLQNRHAPKPQYNYKIETEKVVQRLAALTADDRQKILTEFFDDKLNVAVAILFTLDATLGWTWEERQFWITGFTMAEYDAVIQSWREKRKWDLVRPTTLIKNGKAGNKLTTYSGPFQGVQDIEAVDFESYIRVMPHSEYPSASGCICLVAQEFTDHLLSEKYSMDSVTVNLPIPGAVFIAGSSIIEPGVTPNTDLSVIMRNLTELSNICGESRLWGGMHFTASVAGSRELCKGIGDEVFETMNKLLNGIATSDAEMDFHINDNEFVQEKDGQERHKNINLQFVALNIGVSVTVCLMVIASCLAIYHLCVATKRKGYSFKKVADDQEEEE